MRSCYYLLLAASLLLSLTECTSAADCYKPPYYPTAPDLHAKFLARWELTVGRIPAKCRAPMAWRASDDAYMAQICRTPTAGGCMRKCRFGDVGGGYIRTKYVGDAGLAAHETAHWILLCTTGNADGPHANPLVWGCPADNQKCGIEGFVPHFHALVAAGEL